MPLPIIDASTLALALDDLLSEQIETGRDDVFDLRRILANLSGDTVRDEFDKALVRWTKAPSWIGPRH